MTDEWEKDEQDYSDLIPSVPEHVTCHNHVVLFPWGSDAFCAHLEALALRVDVRNASIEVFSQSENRWKPAEQKAAKLTTIR